MVVPAFPTITVMMKVSLVLVATLFLRIRVGHLRLVHGELQEIQRPTKDMMHLAGQRSQWSIIGVGLSHRTAGIAIVVIDRSSHLEAVRAWKPREGEAVCCLAVAYCRACSGRKEADEKATSHWDALHVAS